MKLTGTHIQLPVMPMIEKGTDNPFPMERSNTRRYSPTFHKDDFCNNNNNSNLSEDGLPPHLFGSGRLITPNNSFDEHDAPSQSTIALSDSFSTYQETRRSVGLPSDYPGHKNSMSIASSLLLEEMEEFDDFFDETPCKKISECSFSTSDDLPLKLSEDLSASARASPPLSSSSSSTSVSTTKQRRRSRHRRSRSEIFSTECFGKMVSASNQKRRHRNHAMGPKVFHDKILTELFADDTLRKKQQLQQVQRS